MAPHLFFLATSHTRRDLARQLCLYLAIVRVVILSEVDAARSAAATESKEPRRCSGYRKFGKVFSHMFQ